MEPSTLFAEFVLGMCAIHLVRQASESITRWRTMSHPEHRTATSHYAKKVVRSDWYVFFSCSDLIGKGPQEKQDQIRNLGNKKRTKRSGRNVVRV